MKFNIGVKGIIVRDGKILVVKRSNDDDHAPGFWETPGGRMDQLHLPQDALKREIKEEVNLDVEVGEPFNVFKFKKDTGEDVVGITFLCNYKNGTVKLSEEHEDFKWIKPEEFKKLKSLESIYKEIEQYAKRK